jgi:hypothetical protein
MDCLKRALSVEELEPSWAMGEYAGIGLIRDLGLRKEFLWKARKRRHRGNAKGTLCHDDLVFLARIPLMPKTTRLTVKASTNKGTPPPLFVIFFQKRDSGLDNLENSIDGQVFIGENFSYLKKDFDLKPEYEACFLYFVPGFATRMELETLAVDLEYPKYEYNYNFSSWMRGFLLGCEMSECSEDHDVLPYMVLRAGASALLRGPDEELERTWKDIFSMKQLDSTPEGLACIVDVCNVLLEPEQVSLPR